MLDTTGMPARLPRTLLDVSNPHVQQTLFEPPEQPQVAPFRSQLLKWVGNKQRFAHEICSFFPAAFGTYYEPFLGSGGVLATLAPEHAVASDSFAPLIEIWQALSDRPEELKAWYRSRWERFTSASDRVDSYEEIKADYNAAPNGADLVFLCRACYGGVVRFRKADGYMSTPCGPHKPVSPDSFGHRVDLWYARTRGATFRLGDYRSTFATASAGDLVYCDPPYSHSQAILYGAQDFSLIDLLDAIADAKDRNVFVALSIDGTKKSGNTICELPIPAGLFQREQLVNCGGSMLRRLQRIGQHGELVADRLLLTY